MARYLKIDTRGLGFEDRREWITEWVDRSTQGIAALSQFDPGSLQSRAAARALAERAKEESLILSEGNCVYMHERLVTASPDSPLLRGAIAALADAEPLTQ